MRDGPSWRRRPAGQLVLTLAAAAACVDPAVVRAQEPGPAARLEQAFSQAQRWLAEPAGQHRERYFDATLALESRRYEAPRPLRVWIARVDLSRARPRLAVTEPLEAAKRVGRWEVPAATTLQFARQRGVQLAVNAAAFWPHRPQMGQPMDVIGLLVVRGQVISPPDPRFAAICVDARGRITLAAPQRPDHYRYVVPGFRMVLIDGKPAAWLAPPPDGKTTLHPRTGIGLDAAGRTLWLVVADGRQPGISEGLSQIELAALLRLLGADDAMNLDGGGSSTMVIEHADGVHRVVNTPVGLGPPGTLRRVGVNLGFYLPGVGPAAVEPRSLREAMIQAATDPGSGRSGPLRYDGRTFDLAGRDRRRVRLLRTFVAATHALAMQRWGEQAPPRSIASWDAEAFGRFVEAFFEPRPAASAPATRPIEPRAAAMLAAAKLASLHRDAWFAQRGDLIWLRRPDGRWRVAMFWARTIDDDGRVRLWLWPGDRPATARPDGPAAPARWQSLGIEPIDWPAHPATPCVIASWH